MPVSTADLPMLLSRFDLSNQVAGLSEQTRDRYYTRTLRQWGRFLTQMEAQTIDREALDSFILQCRQRKLSPYTIRGYERAISRFCHWLQEEGHTQEYLLEGRRTSRVPRQARTIPTMAQVQVALQHLSRRTYWRDRAIFLLVIDADLRLNEVRTLRLEDLQSQWRLITVTGKGSHRRTIRVGREAWVALLDYLEKGRQESGSPYVFLSRETDDLMGWGAMEKVWTRLRDRAGVHWRFHDLRHSGAVQDALGGMDPWELMEKLGHVTMAQTLHYTAAARKMREPVRLDPDPL